MPAAARFPCHPSAVGAWGWGGLDGHESPLSAWWGDPLPTARATDVTAVPVGPRGCSTSSKANWTQPRGAPGMAGTRGTGDGRPARGALRLAGRHGEHRGWLAGTGSTTGSWEPAGRARPAAGIAPRAFGWSRGWSPRPRQG